MALVAALRERGLRDVYVLALSMGGFNGLHLHEDAPRMRFWASPGDRVIPKRENTDACAALARERGATVEVTMTEGDHGDPSDYDRAGSCACSSRRASSRRALRARVTRQISASEEVTAQTLRRAGPTSRVRPWR